MSRSEHLLSEKEAADKLGLSPSTLRNWRWKGEGPAHLKLGGAVRYRPEDLQGFLLRNLKA